MQCLVAVKDVHNAHVVLGNHSRAEAMPFTRKVYTEVPRQLFRLINRYSINLRVHQEGRKSWDIQEERGNVFPIAHWGPEFNGTQFASRAHKLGSD